MYRICIKVDIKKLSNNVQYLNLTLEEFLALNYFSLKDNNKFDSFMECLNEVDKLKIKDFLQQNIIFN